LLFVLRGFMLRVVLWLQVVGSWLVWARCLTALGWLFLFLLPLFGVRFCRGRVLVVGLVCGPRWLACLLAFAVVGLFRCWWCDGSLGFCVGFGVWCLCFAFLSGVPSLIFLWSWGVCSVGWVAFRCWVAGRSLPLVGRTDGLRGLWFVLLWWLFFRLVFLVSSLFAF